MNCPQCQQENRAGANFCSGCGAKLEILCPKCSQANPPQSRFCDNCGEPLTQTETHAATKTPVAPDRYTPKHLAEKILTSKSAVEGERKQVTVLFADLKGSMELLADRDPEESRTLLNAVVEHMMEAVHRYEGTVNNVMGDGIMAIFGAPMAHEDHAVRGCYAALRMQEAVNRYSDEAQRSGGVPVTIRVGLNSGEVVVGSIGNDLRMDYTAVGQTTHLAARMEQMARPGSILLAAETVRLAEGFVQVKPLGAIPVKGLADPIEVYEATGGTSVRSRLQAASLRGFSRFVGRDTEMDQLRRALQQAASGRGQVVAAVGEPGVGKSRLFWEFSHSHWTQGWQIFQSCSSSYGKATAYLPVIDLLKFYFQVDERDDQRKITEKVTGKLLTLDRALEPTLPVFLALLDVPVEEPQWQNLDPPQRRVRTLEALKRLLLRESQNTPVLLVFEDLHWVDSETQAFLDSLIESLPTGRLLLLANYRPEYQHTWGSKSFYTQLRLDPLPPQSAGELLRALLGNDFSLDGVKRLLIERTEGNPFFLEESVRTLVETGDLVGEQGAYRLAKDLPSIEVPTRVQAVLAARMDRLPPEEKYLLQSASVIGESVPLTLLQAVVEMRDEDLLRSLGSLQAVEFLYETGLFPDIEYTFKHGLTYQVAYESLLQDRRRALHERITSAIESLYSDRLAEQVERLAYHALRGEVWDKAATYLRQAGQKAAARSAYLEAVPCFQHALDALEHLPQTRTTLERAVDVRVELGPVLIANRGFGVPEVEQSYIKARQICEQLGETPQLFPVLWGLTRIYDLGGEPQKARELGDELFSIARRAQDPALLLEAHHTEWARAFTLGELSSCRAHTERGTELYHSQDHNRHAFLYGGHDPGVCALRHAAMTLWLLGYPDLALQKIRDALALAQKLSHPFSLATALYYHAWVHQQRGEQKAVQERIEATMALATEQNFTRWSLQGAFLQGWLLVQQGRGREGLLEMRRGDISSTREQSYHAALLAEAYRGQGQIDEGLGVLTEELARIDRMSLPFYEAELLRMKGELVLRQEKKNDASTRNSQAEACFRQAIETARRQGAKSLELRSVTSLSRLLQQQRKTEEARRMLAEIYGWFTEGFDTADLKEAKALLEKLS